MSKKDLLIKIGQLEVAAEQMRDPDRTFKLNDVSQLKIALEAMSLEDIAQKMQTVELPTIQEMESAIQLAKGATSTHDQRVDYFNKAYGIIKSMLGLVL